jgi:hypothetical protein
MNKREKNDRNQRNDEGKEAWNKEMRRAETKKQERKQDKG